MAGVPPQTPPLSRNLPLPRTPPPSPPLSKNLAKLGLAKLGAGQTGLAKTLEKKKVRQPVRTRLVCSRGVLHSRGNRSPQTTLEVVGTSPSAPKPPRRSSSDVANAFGAQHDNAVHQRLNQLVWCWTNWVWPVGAGQTWFGQTGQNNLATLRLAEVGIASSPSPHPHQPHSPPCLKRRDLKCARLCSRAVV